MKRHLILGMRNVYKTPSSLRCSPLPFPHHITTSDHLNFDSTYYKTSHTRHYRHIKMASANSRQDFESQHLRLPRSGSGHDDECSICYEPYGPGHRPVEAYNLDGCTHVFGYKCLKKYLDTLDQYSPRRPRNCPTCRRTWFQAKPSQPNHHQTAMEFLEQGFSALLDDSPSLSLHLRRSDPQAFQRQIDEIARFHEEAAVRAEEIAQRVLGQVWEERGTERIPGVERRVVGVVMEGREVEEQRAMVDFWF